MAAVTTDIPPSWRSPRPSVRVVRLPLAEVVRPGSVADPVDAFAARALLPSRPSGPVRVAPAAYRLRRAAALAVVVVLALAAWVGLEAVAGALGVSGTAASVSIPTAPVTIEVAPGDTYWSIASRLQPQGDLRPLIDRLVAAHGRGVLQAGERLSVPRS